MEIIDGHFYFLKENYLQKHQDKTLMSTHKPTGRRPFYCVSDAERPDIKWMIPLSTNISKWSNIIKQKRINNEDYSLIVINRIKDHDKLSTFLIQNACPCLEYDIDDEWKDKNGVPVSMNIMFDKKMQKLMKLVAYKTSIGLQNGYISMQTVKEVMKEYVKSRTITSKEFANKCMDALKTNNPEQLENYIVRQENGKKYSIVMAEIDYEKDNINVLVDRVGKTFVVNCLDKEKMDCNFEKENQRDIFREELLNSEMEMD